MYMRFCAYLLALLGCVVPAAAQELYFRPMAGTLKLPSDECYNIMCDKSGYIWVATENGLCRYSGNSVKVFDARNGLPEKAVYYMEEDTAGTIWLITSANRILQLVHDTMREAPFSAAYLDFRKRADNWHVTFLLQRKKNGEVLVTDYFHSYTVDRDNRVAYATGDSSAKQPAHCILYISNEDAYLVRNAAERLQAFYRKKAGFVLDLVSGSVTRRITLPFKKEDSPGSRIKMAIGREHIFVGIEYKLVKINRRTLQASCYDLPNPIFSLLQDAAGGLWAGMKEAGLFYFRDIEKMEADAALEGSSVSGICQDREGGIWCTTLEKNVFYCGSTAIRYFPKEKELCRRSSFLKAAGDTVFTSTTAGELLCLCRGKVKKIKLLPAQRGDLTDIARLNGHWYVATKTRLLAFSERFARQTLLKRCTYRLDTFRNSLYALELGAISKVTGTGLSVPLLLPYKSKYRNFVCDGNTIYLGGNEGVYKLDMLSGAGQKPGEISAAVSRIIKTRSGQVFIATKGESLWCVQNGRLLNMGAADRRIPALVNDMCEGPDSCLWLATNAGLVKVQSRYGKYYCAGRYSVASGLPYDNVTALAATRTHIYFSTIHGLFCLPLNAELKNTVPPAFYVNALYVNGKATPFRQGCRLAYTDNSLELAFDVLSFKKDNREPALMYCLKGRDTSFKVVRDHKLVFDNLLPGNYGLLVYALNNDGVKSRPILFTFTIQKPFWANWWFIAACILLALFVIVSVTTAVIKAAREKEAEKAQINRLLAESQLSALQAQMNPHFIFNAINSIQNYILSKENEQAYHYLVKFSSLTRMVLNHSRQYQVTLLKELELLRLYVEIEQLRFGNRFSFHIAVDEAIDQQGTELPTMLIQPYIENAIRHGLINLEAGRPGRLSLSISRVHDLLKIVVQDNGVGRVKAAEYKSRIFQGSVGMEVTGQRLEMINRLRGLPGLRATIKDLYDADGNAGGTQVELFLAVEWEENKYE